MATTRIMPLHTGKGRSVGTAISDILDYVKNPQKTDGGRLITSVGCDSRIADAGFLFSKGQYLSITGRTQENAVIAYHVRQSFRPGEVTPEEANRIGVEFAQRFLKGNNAFIVCTHVDRRYTHNHIIWNSTTLSCDRKFRNFWGSTKAVRNLSDTICVEHQLSIVENPKRHGKSYNKWLGDQAKPGHRELLRAIIDGALEKKPVRADTKEAVALKSSKPGVIITIAREHGSSGKEIGRVVAQRLGIPFYYKEMIALAARESGLNQEFISDIHKNSPDILRDLYLSTRVVQYAVAAQEKIIRKISDNGSCVIVGRAADYVLRNYDNVVRVFIHAPKEYRIGRVMEIYGDSRQEAQRNIHRSDKARAAYYKHISDNRWGDARHYELMVDSSVGIEKTADMLLQYVSQNTNATG